MKNEVLHCKQCVMDSIGNPEFSLDDHGICNYCHEYYEKEKIRLIQPENQDKELSYLVNKIKSSGKGKQYDCIIGVSGGVDSTYTAYLVKKLGLKPLAVHFDNGWNSELAVHNIQKVLEVLNIDLHTFVVNWDEFKDLQLSFLKASTPDGEIPSDHAILSTLYKIASKYGIKYVISGNNFKTEGIMPRLWAYGHIDWKYIKSIHKIFGVKSLKTFPHITVRKFLWYTIFRRIRMVSILNYIDYNKDEAMGILVEKLNWQYYGGKHYESNYTKFYQGIILPQKFHIDKRKLHLSALILCGDIKRNVAIEELLKPIYPVEKSFEDKEYLAKKFDLSIADFDELLYKPNRTFLDYPNNYKMFEILRKFLSLLRKKKLYFN